MAYSDEEEDRQQRHDGAADSGYQDEDQEDSNEEVDSLSEVESQQQDSKKGPEDGKQRALADRSTRQKVGAQPRPIAQHTSSG